ncbi:MAG: hypothetical protein ACOC22_00760 [bacterium]
MAENFKSQGTFGLPHFKNSRAAQELYEPAYLNLFTVQIALPEGVGSSDENKNLVLENIVNVSGLLSNSFPTSPQSQFYKWAERRFAGSKPDQTTMDVAITFQVNLNKTPSAYVLKTLRKWNDLVYDPLTGRTGLKRDYVAPWALITMYDRASRPYWQWKLYYVFPITAIPAPELNYQGEDIYQISDYTLACDYWDESIV